MDSGRRRPRGGSPRCMRGRATPCARRAESREPGCVLGGFALHGVGTFRASIGRADNQGEGRSRDQGRTRDADTVPTVSVMGTPEWERPPPGRAGITNAHRRWTVLAPRLEFLGPTYYMQSEKLILASRAAPGSPRRGADRRRRARIARYRDREGERTFACVCAHWLSPTGVAPDCHAGDHVGLASRRTIALPLRPRAVSTSPRVSAPAAESCIYT